MPLVRITLVEGRSEADRCQIGDAVHRALVETMDVLEHDRFQIIERLPTGSIIRAEEAPSVTRTDALVIIQITLNRGRTSAMKRCFFERAAALLWESVQLRSEDIFIGLVEVDPDNWFVP